MKIKLVLSDRGFYFGHLGNFRIIYYSEIDYGNVRNLIPVLDEKYKKICSRMKLKYNGEDVKR